MNKDIYDGLVARLTANVLELKTIRLFNNQFNHSNNEDQRDEQALLYPCCLIEFSEIEYQTQTQLIQSYTGIVRLHIGFESYKLEDTDILALKQKVYKNVHGFQVSTLKTFGKFLRLRETMDTDHDNIMVYIQEYQLSGKDTDFSSADTNVIVSPPIELEITGDLDIDNAVIRTGDGL